MSMPERTKAMLAERRRQKRANRVREERERSDTIIRQSSARHRAKVNRMRVRYFQRAYGERWADVMRERS